MEVKHIVSINVNSVRSYDKRNNLEQFIRSNQSNIVFLSETHLNVNSSFKVNGFNIFKQFRVDSNGGGTAILIKNGIKYRNIKTGCNNKIEFTAVEIFVNNLWLKLISIYIPPRSNLKADEIESFLNLNSTCPTIIGGDFNARNVEFGDSLTSQMGKTIAEFILNTGFVRFNTNIPTYKDISFIDAFIVSNEAMPFVINSSAVPINFSDHSAVFLYLKLISNCENKYKKLVAYNFADINKLNKFVEEKINSLELPICNNVNDNELENIINEFNNILTKAVEKFVPKIKVEVNKIKLSSQTEALKKHFRNAANKFYRNRLSYNANILKSNMNIIKTSLNNSIKHDINIFYKNKLIDISYNRKLYDTIRICSGYKNKDKPEHFNIMNKTNNSILNNKEKNEALANKFLANHCHTLDNISTIENVVLNEIELFKNQRQQIQFNNEILADVETKYDLENINNMLHEEYKNILTCTEEINEVITGRRNKKSTGTDRMPVYLLKFLNQNVLNRITIIFNHLLANGYFPISWKHAIIVPIPKNGKNQNEIDGWRPISQLNSIAKIFEKIIHNRMMKHVVKNNILPNFQFGFLNDRSTIQPLSIFNNFIADNLNKNKMITAMTIDVQSAFDSVWHNGVIYKLILNNFPPLIIKSITSFLNKRTFEVGENDDKSELKFIPAGSPQGSVVSPLLWNIYIADLPTHPNIKILQYADDTLLYFGHQAPLLSQMIFNSYLKKLSDWFTTWKLKVNENKTELIHFVGTGNDVNQKIKKANKQIIFKFNNVKLKPVDSFKYLGVVFSSKANFNRQIDNIIKKVKTRSAQLRTFINSSFIQPKFKNHVYKQYIRPLFQYACPVWFNPSMVSSHQIERIRKMERKLIRKTSNTFRKRNCYKYINNSKLYKNAEVKRIDIHLAKINIDFHDKCKNNNCNEIKKISDTNLVGKYRSSDTIFNLRNNNLLLENDKFLIFNKAKFKDKIVYNTNQ